MKISYNLLKEYIELPPADPHSIAPAIAEHCFEVEFIHQIGGKKALKFSNVIAAEVLQVEKHPNADRLRVVRLNIGDKIIDPVVCGAWNFEAGDMVALALPGAQIPQNIHSEEHEPFTLGSAKIRGIESQGMICSAFELGLIETPEEKPVIMILPKEVKPGTDLFEYYTKQSEDGARTDYLLDFAMPANRPDLHSHIGVAQELSGMLGYKKTKSFRNAQESLAAAKPLKYNSKSKVQIENNSCALYLGARIKVSVGATPETLLVPLRTLGHSGVNNIVDITNFVMAETGQPLHAYDASKIEGAISVRSANKNEKIIALDGKEYVLPETALVIADQLQALGIAGIIGGNDSKISNDTTEIILEAALFDRIVIRRASKEIGLRTEASGLFEKGTTREQALYAFNRTVQLLKEYASGQVIEIFGSAIPSIEKNRKIKFTANQINTLLGGKWTSDQIKKILNGLGIETSGSRELTAEIPWYRQDIEDAAGLADEVVRFIGMNIIPKEPLQLQRSGLQYNREEGIWKAKDSAVLLGYQEVQGYSFISADEIITAGRNPKEFIKVSNPLSSETEFLRRDLGEGLLKIAAGNAKHTENFKIFEVGFGYHGYDQEKLFIAFALHKKNLSPESLIAELKGDLQSFLHELGVNGELKFKTAADGINFSSFDLQNKDGKTITDLGAMVVIDHSHGLAQRFDLETNVILCQLQLDKAISLISPQSFSAFNKLPTSSIDLSIIVDQSTEWHAIEEILKANGGAFLKDIQMIDAPYFYGKGSLPLFHQKLQKEGRKNLVFRLVFAKENSTLQDSEISEIYAKIKVQLESKISAEIR